MERVKIYNLSSISGYKLFPACRELNEQGHAGAPGAAIVLAQASVELGFERAISMVFEVREIPDAVSKWIRARINKGGWSPDSERPSQLWEALTGDNLKSQPFWTDYKAGVFQRHAVAHQAALGIATEDAARFIDAAEALLAHVGDVLAGMGDSS